MSLDTACTAFLGFRCIISAPAIEVGLLLINQLESGEQGNILCFNDATGKLFDFDFSRGKNGLIAELAARGHAGLTISPDNAVITDITDHNNTDDENSAHEEQQPSRGRGRPKLGVVSKEVTLLPRHWEWLNAQPAGASATLRRLVEQARKASGVKSRKDQAVEAAYHFIHAIAGELTGFDEVIRALFAHDDDQFKRLIAEWPKDVQDYAIQLATP